MSDHLNVWTSVFNHLLDQLQLMPWATVNMIFDHVGLTLISDLCCIGQILSNAS